MVLQSMALLRKPPFECTAHEVLVSHVRKRQIYSAASFNGYL